MINTIKIKNGDDLELLLRHPKLLVTLLAITLDKEVDMTSNEVLDLKSMGFISDKGVKSSFISTNEKRATKVGKLDNRLLKEVKVLEVPQFDLAYYKIALSFHALFESNMLDIGAKLTHLKAAKYSKWVTPIRLMIENDKVTENELREVWKFLKGHYFWSANIQSTEKLRKQFNTVYTQLKSDGKKQQDSDSKKGEPRTISTEYAKGIFDNL